jgi:hypothetical protein
MTGQGATSSAETISDNQGTPNVWTKQCNASTSQQNTASIWTAPCTQTSAGFAVTYSGMGTAALGSLVFAEVTGQAGNGIDGTPNATNYANASVTALSNNVGTAAFINDLALMIVVPNSTNTQTWGAPLTLLNSNTTQAQPVYSGSGTEAGSGSITLTSSQPSGVRTASAGILISSGMSSAIPPTLMGQVLT